MNETMNDTINDICILDCTIIPMEPPGKVIKNGGILIEEGRIVQLDSAERIRKNATTHYKIDAKDCVALPGLINTQTYLAHTLFRNLCMGLSVEEGYKKIQSAERQLTSSDASTAAQLGVLEMVKSGVTSLIDTTFYAVEIADALKTANLKGIVCIPIFCGTPEYGSVDTQLRRAKFVKAKIEGDKSGNGYERLRAGLNIIKGWRAADYEIENLISYLSDNPSKTVLELPVAEEEVNFSKRMYGLSPIQRLEVTGLLKKDCFVTNCSSVEKVDTDILAKNDATAVRTLLDLRKKSNIADFINKGINITVGTGSCAFYGRVDLFETIRYLYTQRFEKNLPYNLLAQITVNSANAMHFPTATGTIEIGNDADIVILNLKKPHFQPVRNIFESIIGSGTSADVETVIASGRLLLEKQKVKYTDEAKINEAATAAAQGWYL